MAETKNEDDFLQDILHLEVLKEEGNPAKTLHTTIFEMLTRVLWVVIGGLVNLRTCECGQIHILTQIFSKVTQKCSA